MTTKYRALPSVDKLLGHPDLRGLTLEFPREAVVSLIRDQLELARKDISIGLSPPTSDTMAGMVAKKGERLWTASPSHLINATGVIIHTNLGRAPLSVESEQALIQASQGYTDLEFSLESGERSSRFEHVEHLLCQLTGAEAAIVVNNNASAVLLTLTALTKNKEVIVSRGESVEIGGGFRVPDVMRQSGATLIEVGTTNRTYPSDYRESINPNTAALLKIHRSNFKILGFTHETSTEELATLGHENDLLVLDDLGSGCLLETSLFGMDHEPTPTEKIKAGADLVMFSGDKLLGGPQAGIIIGRKSSIKQISNHPLARALRIDKFNLAALSATLLHYVKEEALAKIPIWQMISRDESSLFEQAQEWAKSIGPKSVVIPGKSTVGGGSLPGESLPTWLLSIPCENESSVVLRLAKKLRENKPPVIARIQDDSLLLDPRTVLPKEENSVIQAVKQVIKN